MDEIRQNTIMKKKKSFNVLLVKEPRDNSGGALTMLDYMVDCRLTNVAPTRQAMAAIVANKNIDVIFFAERQTKA